MGSNPTKATELEKLMVPAQKSGTPIFFANHVQFVSMGDQLIIEFRALVPDVADIPRGTPMPEGGMVIEAPNISEIPATHKVLVPIDVVIQLRDMIDRSIVKHEK